MRRQFQEVRDLCKKYDCPFIVAGDLFDKWKVSPELINFAMDELPPEVIAIPGQHDLPDHSMDQIHRSGYWTLVLAERIYNLKPYECRRIAKTNVYLTGFPWGTEIRPGVANPDRFDIAIVHDYIWMKDRGYIGAPADKRIGAYRVALSSFDGAVFGDNHQGFFQPNGIADGQWVLNCGSFFRRHANEMHNHPGVGLLHDDGSCTPYPLTSADADQFVEMDQVLELVERGTELAELVGDLVNLSRDARDFVGIVKEFFTKHPTGQNVVNIVMKALEESRGK